MFAACLIAMFLTNITKQHTPECPSKVWFIERLLGAAKPFTLLFLSKQNRTN